MNNSGSFLVPAFDFNIAVHAANLTGFRTRDWFGHSVIHLMQEMQREWSVMVGSSLLILSAGHLEAHSPHLLHLLVTCGIMLKDDGARYGRLPGISGVVMLLDAIFSESSALKVGKKRRK